MSISVAASLLALLPASIQVQVRPSGLPLVVSEAEYHAAQSLVEFSVRNDGSEPVVAWAVGLTWQYPGGNRASETVYVDSYEQAAGLPTAAPDDRVLARGETMRRRLNGPPKSADAAGPNLLEMETRAVLLAGNAPLGDARCIEQILSRRKEHREAWSEILKVLKAQESVPDGQTMDRATDALRSRRSERTMVGVLSRRLLYGLRTAERTPQEKAQVFQDLLQQVERHATAAERFATPSANRR